MRTVKEIQSEIDALYKEILEIQKECSHSMQESKCRTGYGYGTESEYWEEVTCLHCGYKWIEN